MSIDDFGVTNSMQTLSGILIIIISLALDRSIGRIYYDYTNDKDRKDFLGTIFLAILTVGIIGTLSCLFAKNYLNQLFPDIPFYPYFTYTIIYTFCLLIINFAQMIAQVKQNSTQFMFVSLLLMVLTAFINLVFITKFEQGALGYVKGMLIGAITMIPLILIYINKNINYTFKLVKFKAAIMFSLPVLPSILSAWVLNLSDRVFINHYYSQADVGIYSLGYRLASLIIFIAGAFYMAYNPVFFEIANRPELSSNAKKEKLYSINSGVILVIGILGICLLLGSDIILKLFFKSEYLTSYHYISIFALSFIIAQIGTLFNLMTYQNKKTQLVALVIIISAALNITLNYFLIPLYGVYFAAVNNLISTVVNFILMYFLARKNFYIKTDWKMIFIILIFYIFVYFENTFLLKKDLIISIPIKVLTGVFMLLIFKKSILTVIKTIKGK